MTPNKTKQKQAKQRAHLSLVVCGHTDSGKSTTTGRLLFELGCIPERELEKLKEEADNLGKSSFAFAFYMDRHEEERERGLTISCTVKEFFTDKWHYTIIDAPGHRAFIKNMISGSSQADVALLLVPADGNFVPAIQRGDAEAGEIQGQTRHHARILNLLGVRQLVIGVNKMDCDVVGYKEDRYNEIRDEMRNMLIRAGWKKNFVANSVPVIPISGWMGDNLLEKSSNMGWWNGVDITVEDTGEKMKVVTIKECLNDMAQPPKRETHKPLRLPIYGIYKVQGVGDVVTGRVEQGMVSPSEDVIFIPTHTSDNPCEGKVFSIDIHHRRVDAGKPGDIVDINVKGLREQNMPRCGDVMVHKKDGTLKGIKSFTCQVMTMDNLKGKITCGYSPIGYVRGGRAACRMTEIIWKMGKETGGQKLESPPHLMANEVGAVTFEPMTPLVCDDYRNCEGLSRMAFLDDNTVVMLGKVVSTIAREETPTPAAPPPASQVPKRVREIIQQYYDVLGIIYRCIYTMRRPIASGMCVYIYACIYSYIYIFKYTHTHTHTHTRIYIHIYNVCACVWGNTSPPSRISWRRSRCATRTVTASSALQSCDRSWPAWTRSSPTSMSMR